MTQARRCLAIASVLESWTHWRRQRVLGYSGQTPRDWVYRYNAEGMAGFLERLSPARASLLSAEQQAEFDRIVEAGLDVAANGVVCWRRIDLKRVVEACFGVAVADRTIGDLLHKRQECYARRQGV